MIKPALLGRLCTHTGQRHNKKSLSGRAPLPTRVYGSVLHTPDTYMCLRRMYYAPLNAAWCPRKACQGTQDTNEDATELGPSNGIRDFLALTPMVRVNQTVKLHAQLTVWNRKKCNYQAVPGTQPPDKCTRKSGI